MALIKCPECTKEISSEALSCPHCGYPVHGSFGEARDESNIYNQSRLSNLSSSDSRRVLQLVKQNKKLNAIKLYREITGCSLKEAKTCIDGLSRKPNHHISTFKKTGGSNKYFGKILGFILLLICAYLVLRWFDVLNF